MWKKLRNYFMSTHVLCADCYSKGITTPATDCHHEIPWSWFNDVEDKWKALLNIDILVPLCEHCHYERHKHLERPKDFEKSKYYDYIHNTNLYDIIRKDGRDMEGN